MKRKVHLTTEEELQHMKLQLMLLQVELDSYARGDWRYEYYMTIGYNKKFTGRKIYNSKP
jgi:hypothetical protein